ncbi:MAG: hypothetical protein AB1540_03715 [Bdellovibrionota bacterium]
MRPFKLFLTSALALGMSLSAVAGTLHLEPGDNRVQLRDCGGTVSVTVSDQGRGEQVNIVFKGVENCSNFDIVSNYGDPEPRKAYKLQGRKNGNQLEPPFHASFTIPKRAIEDGSNRFKMVLYSNKNGRDRNRGHHDDLVVRFQADVREDRSGRSSGPVRIDPPAPPVVVDADY